MSGTVEHPIDVDEDVESIIEEQNAAYEKALEQDKLREKKQEAIIKKRKREEEAIELRKELFRDRKKRAAFIAKICENRKLNSGPKKARTQTTL